MADKHIMLTRNEFGIMYFDTEVINMLHGELKYKLSVRTQTALKSHSPSSHTCIFTFTLHIHFSALYSCPCQADASKQTWTHVAQSIKKQN